MKIYEIGTGYTPIPAKNGAATEIVVEELTKSLLKQGYETELIDIQASTRLPNKLPITEVKVPQLFMRTDVQLGLMHKLKRVVYSVCLAKKLARILKQAEEPVMLHFHNQYNMCFYLKLVPNKLQKKATTAYTVHSYIWHGAWKDIEETVHKRYFQELHCIKHADYVFVLNQRTRENFVTHQLANDEKVFLVDNGVNTDIYHPLAPAEKLANATQWGLEDRKVFIQVGSVCERKNQMQALRMLLPLMQEDKNIVYCYAGGIISEEYQEAITKLAHENGVSDNVRYFGELSPGCKLNEFYNLADAMIFPSQAEGFSLVIIEAMAAGVPVVVSDKLQFLLADECLRYHSEEDIIPLLYSKILDDAARREIVARVRSVVEANYNWDRIAADYCSIWSEIGK